MDIQSFVKNLSLSEQHDLLKFLQYESEVPKFDSLNNSSNNVAKIECPNCADSKVVGHGTYKGRGRYMCKSCKKSFNDYIGTAISAFKNSCSNL